MKASLPISENSIIQEEVMKTIPLASEEFFLNSISARGLQVKILKKSSKSITMITLLAKPWA